METVGGIGSPAIVLACSATYNLIYLSSNLHQTCTFIVYLCVILYPANLVLLRHSLASLALQVHQHSLAGQVRLYSLVSLA